MKFCTNNNVDVKNCTSITTDGAAAMTGIYIELEKLIKDIVLNIKWTRCILHREYIFNFYIFRSSSNSKKIPKELTDVLAQIVKIVNYIKANALNLHLFKILCLEMG